MSLQLQSIESVASGVVSKARSLRGQLKDVRKRSRHASMASFNWTRAESVVREAAKATHDAISLNLSSISSAALNEILGVKCYEVKISTLEKRGGIELEIQLYKDGKLHGEPLESNGGGVCDILSAVLLFVCWKMSGNEANNLFILDEPFKNLSAEYQEPACRFFEQLSVSLELRVLMVTHIPEFIENASHTIEVIRKGGASCIGHGVATTE